MRGRGARVRESVLKFISKEIVQELKPHYHERALPSPIWRGVGGEAEKKD
jgi:hypothetical protein